MISRFKLITAACATAFAFSACEVPPPGSATNSTANTNSAANTTQVAANTNSSPAAVASASPATAEKETGAANSTLTMPVLDAMFADEKFAGELKSKLSLNDEQIQKLKTTAREATAGLGETEEGSTSAASKSAQEQISGVIGADKARELTKFVGDRWAKGDEPDAPDGNNVVAASDKPSSVPTDTRIVVNAPAYRMDLFKDGQIVKSYKIGIGYPEFPLPTGMRKATTLIYNPTWTPPDEPWVKGKIKAGQQVAAGDKMNPLGPVKIPIGSPSLIHGGKSAARLGGFASHGCVGLTDAQIKDVAIMLAQITGTQISSADLASYEKNKTETKNVKLLKALPVELRYETIVVEDGKLKIFRDVYERGTNTEENLKKVLEANGVSFDSLTEPERTKILAALKQMARDAGGNAVDGSTAGNTNTNTNGKTGNVNKNSTTVKETKTVKGAKEVIFEIAALKGKGYPAPKDYSTGAAGGGRKK